MMKVIRAKLHGIRVTNADLNYHGSITLDPEQCELAGLYPMEFVEIWNKNSGARLSTYVIFGVAGSRCCVLNGAAARTCQVGDELIIAAADYIAGPQALYELKPRILTFLPDNQVDQVLLYDVHQSDRRPYDFRIVDAGRHTVEKPPHLAQRRHRRGAGRPQGQGLVRGRDRLLHPVALLAVTR